MPFEEKALIAGTKEIRQIDKAVSPAMFVLWLLLALVLTSGYFPTNIP
jgi:hypothetical protein